MKGVIEFKKEKWTLEIDYTLDTITVQVYSKSQKYTNAFSSSYIQSLTQRVGNYKSFQVFQEMLFDGLDNSDTITFDLLETDSDLKLYLVVTYAIAYDRVHYPLPLKKQSLKSKIPPTQESPQRVLGDSFHRKDDKEIQLLKLSLQRVTHLQPLKLITHIQRLEYILSKLQTRDEELEEAIDILKQIVDPEYIPGTFIQEKSTKGYKVIKSQPLIPSSVPRKTTPRTTNVRQSSNSRLTGNRNSSKSDTRHTTFRNSSKSDTRLNTNRNSSKSDTRLNTNRNSSKSDTRLNTNRNSSKSSNRDRDSSKDRKFKRFDPTEYIRQRNEKRSLSRNGSQTGSRAASVQSLGSRRANSIASRANSIASRASSIASRSSHKVKTKKSVELVEDDDIDNRLKRLELFLSSV